MAVQVAGYPTPQHHGHIPLSRAALSHTLSTFLTRQAPLKRGLEPAQLRQSLQAEVRSLLGPADKVRALLNSLCVVAPPGAGGRSQLQVWVLMSVLEAADLVLWVDVSTPGACVLRAEMKGGREERPGGGHAVRVSFGTFDAGHRCALQPRCLKHFLR